MEGLLLAYAPLLPFVLFYVFARTYQKATGNPEALTDKYIKSRTYSQASEDINKLITIALMNAGFERVGFNSELNVHFANTKKTIWSSGENITVQVIQTHDRQEIQMKSISKLPIFLAGNRSINEINTGKFFRQLDTSKLT